MPDPVIISNDEGEEIELPAKMETCPECNGKGAHAHAIDGNGLTSVDLQEWEEEQFLAYMRGDYDRTCEVCKGDGEVAVVDESALTDEEKKLWAAWCKDEMEYRALRAAERRMGA